MNTNPYQAPATDMAAHAGLVRGAPEPWSIDDVFRRALDIFKIVGAPLTGAVFLAFLIDLIPSQVPQLFIHLEPVNARGGFDVEAFVPLFGFWILGQIVQSFFEVGIIRGILGSLRTGTFRFADVFSGADRFIPFLVARLVVMLVTVIGMLFFIVPGIILALGLSMTSYYVVDQRHGPFDAMRASWDATVGHKGSLFGLFLLFIGVMLAGVLACCIGIFPAGAYLGIAQAIVYMRLAGVAGGTRASMMGTAWGGASGYGVPPGNVPPGGGYGPPGGGYGGYGPPGGSPPGGGGYGPPGGGGGYGPPGA